MSKFKFNPLTGDFNIVPDSGTLIQKLNPVTGDFNLTKEAGKYKQVLCYLSGEFNLRPAVTQVIVHGVGNIQLTNAVENGLLSLKAFGGTEQRNLPSGYTQLEYVYMTAGSYIKVEDLLISSGYRVEFDFQTTTLGTTLRNYLGGRVGGVSAGGGFRLSKLAVSSSYNHNVVLYGFEAGTEYYAPEQFQPNTRYKYTYDNGVCTLESGGSVISTKTFTVTDNTSTSWGINSYGNGSYWQTDTDGIYVYSLKVWNDQDELVMNLVPAKTATEIGFYDMVTGALRTASAGTFEAGGDTPTPDIQVDIISNNGVLKFSKNMANVNAQTALVGYYISAQGVVTSDTNNRIYQEYIPCKPSTTYTLSLSSSVYYVTISEYSTAEDSGFVRRNAGSSGSNTQLTITTGATTNYVRFGTNIDRSEVTLERVLAIDWQLERGDTPTPYHKYVEGGVYVDGTTETIGLGGVFSSADGQGTFVSPSGSTTTRIYKAFNKLTAGTYTVEVSGAFELIFQYKDKIDATPTQYGNLGTRTKSGEYEITDDTLYYGVAIRNDSGTGNITPTNFVNGNGKISIKGANGNVVAEMLLKIGDYADEQEILSGNITRKVGVYAFDGTESFSKLTSGAFRVSLTQKADKNTEIICSHYLGVNASLTTTNMPDLSVKSNATNVNTLYIKDLQYTTESELQAYLESQYNAGTPVIVLYLLATPTTETVTGQPLSIPEGTSTIGIIEASLDNLELEAVYEQEA